MDSDEKFYADIRHEIILIRCELAWRRLKWAFKNLERATAKANFNPSQPRVPRGSSDGGQWTDGGGGSGPTIGGGRNRNLDRIQDLVYRPAQDGVPRAIQAGARGRISITVRLGRVQVEATPGQSSRLAVAEAQARNEIERVQAIEPRWRPTPSFVETAEGLIRAREGEAREARARFNDLARGIGDNGGPPLDLRVDTSPVPSQIMSAFREMTGMPEVRPGAPSRSYRGTVAYTKVDGVPIIGVNSNAPGYTVDDEVAAREMRGRLVGLYPEKLATRNLGYMPNDALYHAEATALLRAQRQIGNLKGRVIEIYVDRRVCESCETVIPLIGLQLGNPEVRYIDPSGGTVVFLNGSFNGSNKR